MAKLAKSWWIPVVAALGVAAIVYVLFDAPQNDSPIGGTKTDSEEGAAIQPVVVSTAQTPSTIAVAGSEPGTPEQESAVDITEVDGSTNAPDSALPETAPRVYDEPHVETGEAAAAAIDANAALAESVAEMSDEALTEDVTDSSSASVEAVARGSEPAESVELPNAASESDISPEITDPDNAGPVIPEQAVLAPSKAPDNSAPDPNLPALSLGELAQSPAPENGNESANAPDNETQPVLGEAGPPLSLAQILPPGEAPAPNQIAPSFDLVRVSPDGSALIAGRAEPGAVVQVFSGTIPVAEATASARGEFVAFLNAPSDKTLDLQIPAAPEGAALVTSQADVVILPASPEAEDTTPIVVRRTPDSVQILQPSAPAVPGNVSLDLVSYADSGDVQLAGRGNPGNMARVYADDKLVGEAQIAEGGTWALEITDIAAGRYVLRVDEISAIGDVLSRTESPFQRQFPAAQMPDSFSQGAKIIVQPGNTLWLMAAEAYGEGGEYIQIFVANKDAIRDPDLIYPGQIFSIPRIEE